MAFTAPDYEAHTCTALVRSTAMLFLCNRTILEAKHFNWEQPSSELPRAFSLCSWMSHEDKSCTQGTPRTSSPTSHVKEEACLLMNGQHPFRGPQTHPLLTASLHLLLPVERLDENASLPWDVSLTLGWEVWFKSAPMQCKDSSFTYMSGSIWFRQVMPQE